MAYWAASFWKLCSKKQVSIMPAYVSLFCKTANTFWQKKEHELRQNNGVFAGCKSVKNMWRSEAIGWVFSLVAARIIGIPEYLVFVLFCFSLKTVYWSPFVKEISDPMV